MSGNKKRYDLICYLGENCAAAHNLRYRNMRLFSLPFDWTYIENTKPIEYLSRAFINHFEDFFLRHNLEQIAGTKEQSVIYYDKISGYYFPNHFKKLILQETDYLVIAEKIKRRIDRLYKKIENAKKILKVIQFAAKEDKEIVIERITLNTYKRKMNDYDFYKINYEWSFLDNIELCDLISMTNSRKNIKIVSFKCFNKHYRLDLSWEKLLCKNH